MHPQCILLFRNEIYVFKIELLRNSTRTYALLVRHTASYFTKFCGFKSLIRQYCIIHRLLFWAWVSFMSVSFMFVKSLITVTRFLKTIAMCKEINETESQQMTSVCLGWESNLLFLDQESLSLTTALPI